MSDNLVKQILIEVREDENNTHISIDVGSEKKDPIDTIRMLIASAVQVAYEYKNEERTREILLKLTSEIIDIYSSSVEKNRYYVKDKKMIKTRPAYIKPIQKNAYRRKDKKYGLITGFYLVTPESLASRELPERPCFQITFEDGQVDYVPLSEVSHGAFEIFDSEG